MQLLKLLLKFSLLYLGDAKSNVIFAHNVLNICALCKIKYFFKKYKLNFYEFFKTRDFYFLEKWKKNLYRGYILVLQKIGENGNRNL